MNFTVESNNGKLITIEIMQYDREDGSYEVEHFIIDGRVWSEKEITVPSYHRLIRWIESKIDIWEGISDWMEERYLTYRIGLSNH